VLHSYIPIFLFVLVATGFAIFTILFARLVHASKPGAIKLEPYECGIEPVGDARDRYSIRYYLIAMLLALDRLALFGLIEMLVFLFILVVGYFYAWRTGALEWQS
jgi:NADH-quinone oxidoreductase subunit A